MSETQEARLRQAEQDIAKLQERQLSNHEDMQEIKAVLIAQAQNIQDIRDAVMEGVGRWKALMAIGGLAGVVMSIVTNLVISLWPRSN